MADKKLSAEQQQELDRAKATILRLEGAPPPPDPAAEPPVLRRYRVRLHGVTWDEKTGRDIDNTTRAMVKDPKTRQAREAVIDRAVVEAFNTADAWQKFLKAWGIRSTDHTPSFAEVRDLTEDEKKAPPKDVLPFNRDVLVGVPPPHVFPVYAPPMNPTPANMEKWSQKTGLPVPELAG